MNFTISIKNLLYIFTIIKKEKTFLHSFLEIFKIFNTSFFLLPNFGILFINKKIYKSEMLENVEEYGKKWKEMSRLSVKERKKTKEKTTTTTKIKNNC